MYISKRQKNAGIEMPSTGGNIGISTAVRKYWRKYYQNVPGMIGTNDYINTVIASDYAKATPIHRFILKSNEPAEIRKSGSFLYVSAIRSNGRHDIIVIQPSYKQGPESTTKRRMSDDWIRGVHSGDIKSKK